MASEPLEEGGIAGGKGEQGRAEAEHQEIEHVAGFPAGTMAGKVPPAG